MENMLTVIAIQSANDSSVNEVEKEAGRQASSETNKKTMCGITMEKPIELYNGQFKFVDAAACVVVSFSSFVRVCVLFFIHFFRNTSHTRVNIFRCI